LHGGDAAVGGVYDTYTQDLYRYQLLYDNVITQLNQFINYFTVGDYTKLVDKYTVGQQNRLLLKAQNSQFYSSDITNLVGFTYDDKKFGLMRKSTYDVIDGLNQTITVVQQNKNFENEITNLTYYKNILDTPKLLIEYIDKKKLNTMVFQATEIFQSEIILKPWFKKYLQLYGAPGNGVFKSELLSEIVIELIADGTITEEDFILG
jgi:hypothetical protein